MQPTWIHAGDLRRHLKAHSGEKPKNTSDVREAAKKEEVFFWISFPNLFTHPPTPGFLRDLGKRKVKFGSKKGIFGAIWFFFLGVWTLFGNQPPHPPTFGKDIKKNVFFLAASLTLHLLRPAI